MKQAAIKIMECRVAAAKLKNVRCWLGMIEAFDQPFDIALALHACGRMLGDKLDMIDTRREKSVCGPASDEQDKLWVCQITCARMTDHA